MQCFLNPHETNKAAIRAEAFGGWVQHMTGAARDTALNLPGHPHSER